MFNLYSTYNSLINVIKLSPESLLTSNILVLSPPPGISEYQTLKRRRGGCRNPGRLFRLQGDRLVNWFISLLVYHVESPFDERHGLLHAAVGSLANLEVILLQKSSIHLLVDISSPLLSNKVPPQISKWL